MRWMMDFVGSCFYTVYTQKMRIEWYVVDFIRCPRLAEWGCLGNGYCYHEVESQHCLFFELWDILKLSSLTSHISQWSYSISGRPLFESTAEIVAQHYRGAGGTDSWVPWQPYNFHAGNFYCEKTGYSPQVGMGHWWFQDVSHS